MGSDDSEKFRRAKLEICRREIKAALADGDTVAAREIEKLADSIGPVHIRKYRKRILTDCRTIGDNKNVHHR